MFQGLFYCWKLLVILILESIAQDRTFLTRRCGRRGGLMVSELDSRSSGPGSSPGRGHCVEFLGKTLDSHSASLLPGVGLGLGQI